MLTDRNIPTAASTLVAGEQAKLVSVARGFAEFHRAQAALIDPDLRRSDAIVEGLVAERDQAVAMIVGARSRTPDDIRRKAVLAATLALEDAPTLAAVASLAMSIAADVGEI